MKKLSVFLADDHAVVREGLKLVVETDPELEVVGEAGDGQTALDQIEMCKPDIAIIDLSMPKMGGLEITNALKTRQSETKVLILTMHENAGYVTELLDAGALGYVVKHIPTNELLKAIHTVARGEIFIDPALTGAVVSDFVQRKPRTEEGKRPLSEREEEVLQLLAQGHSNKEIAAKLGISAKSVETYKSRSMDKAGLQNRADIVRYALEQGWLHRI